MTKIKATDNTAEAVETKPVEAKPVEVEAKQQAMLETKPADNATTKMTKERLKFYIDHFNTTQAQVTEMEERLKELKTTGTKLSGSISALQEMLKSAEAL